MKRKGFTVIEVMTVVIILAILATLAVPPFIKTMDAAKGRLAKTNLKLIYAAEKVYRNEVGYYMPVNPDGSGRIAKVDDIKKFLGLDFPDLVRDDKEFEYIVDTSTGPATYFRATARRPAGKRHAGTELWIDPDEGEPKGSFPP